MILLSKGSEKVIAALHCAGFEAFLVGGCVRDGLMGRVPSDFDVCTNALPQQVKQALCGFKTVDTGIRHGTVTVIYGDEAVEVTTYRIDGEYKDSRRPESVSFTRELRNDLSRRDFTVNAMAYDKESGIIDCFGGREDIEKKIIRCVGEPSQRFSEDALRILRALRFAAKLGFTVEEKTKRAVFSERARLKNIAMERIADEMRELLCADNARTVLCEYGDIIRIFLPFYKVCPEELCKYEKNFSVRLAAIFGKDTQKCCHILKLSGAETQLAVFLAQHENTLLDTKEQIKHLLSHSNEKSVRTLVRMRGRGEELLDEIIRNKECYSIQALQIDGNDLIKMGFRGRETGEALSEILEKVIENKLKNDRIMLLSYIERKNKMDIKERSLEKHYQWKGKLEIKSRAAIENGDDLSVAYTPGVAQPCLEIQKDYSKSFELTRRWNTVAVVTDGTAVLGLGDIGPEAGMPVMEGKCVLFKEFGDVDAFPICIRSKDADEIVKTVYNISGGFGGINLEDISAPRCFEIEEKLKKLCDIPVFHDDQHGTAIVVAAALLNALKIVGKEIDKISVVINGAGSAGIAIVKHLLRLGVKNICMCDRKGIVCEGDESLNNAKKEISLVTNRQKKKGTLADALVGADVFLGVSAPNTVSGEMVKSMAKGAIVFPMANPTPEIMPDLAKEAGAAVIGTGRSDFPNQINNVLAFPGIFRGALDCRASEINDEMKVAATKTLASLVSDAELSPEYILPKAFDKNVGVTVAKAVFDAAKKTGVARI